MKNGMAGGIARSSVGLNPISVMCAKNGIHDWTYRDICSTEVNVCYILFDKLKA